MSERGLIKSTCKLGFLCLALFLASHGDLGHVSLTEGTIWHLTYFSAAASYASYTLTSTEIPITHVLQSRRSVVTNEDGTLGKCIHTVRLPLSTSSLTPAIFFYMYFPHQKPTKNQVSTSASAIQHIPLTAIFWSWIRFGEDNIQGMLHVCHCTNQILRPGKAL